MGFPRSGSRIPISPPEYRTLRVFGPEGARFRWQHPRMSKQLRFQTRPSDQTTKEIVVSSFLLGSGIPVPMAHSVERCPDQPGK